VRWRLDAPAGSLDAAASWRHDISLVIHQLQHGRGSIDPAGLPPLGQTNPPRGRRRRSVSAF
jgi:hypothetical protein